MHWMRSTTTKLGLPMVQRGNVVDVYLRYILDDHRALIEQDENVTIEDIPNC